MARGTARPHRQGGLLRPVGKLAMAAAKRAGKAAWRRWFNDRDPQQLTAEGLIEPPARSQG
jgi:hypothetical protein